MAQQLDQHINDQWGEEAAFVVVGFSMGTLISRYYLQGLGGAERCSAFFSISGPHRGSFWGYFYPGKGTRQMRPNSEFLKNLDATVERLGEIPIVSYWTPFDLMIVPATTT